MGLRRNLAVAVALAVSVALATGCRSGGDSGPVVTVPEAPTTTAGPADPYAVPAVIDEAYVNRVLAALDAAVGDVVRLVVKTHSFPPEAYDRLKAIYGDAEWLQLAVDGFQDDLSNGLRDYAESPGNRETTVQEILTADGSCIFTRVTRDYSGVGRAPRSETQWIAMRSAGRSSFNGTGWALTYDGFQKDGLAPANPCSGS